jgi:N-acyl-D-amino-acid deacylase
VGHFSARARPLREKKLLSLETAIHKMTGLGAWRFGLRGRGILAAGNFADIVIFDEQRIADRATFEQPTRVSAGIDAVIVNGRLACARGESVDVHAGRVLRRTSQ